MKKVMVVSGLFATLLLAGCQTNQKDDTSASSTKPTIVGSTTINNSTTATSESTSESSVEASTTAESTSPAESTEATVASTTEKTTESTAESTEKATDTATAPMDFEKIKAGDYSDLLGEWHQIYEGYNAHNAQGFQLMRGGTASLTVTPNQISDGGVTLVNTTLTDNNGSQEIAFTEENQVLRAGLVNESIASNWSVTFYPVGTTSDYPIDDETSNTKNLIVIWTSNNSYTEVFAQGSVEETQNTGLDLEQIQRNDFSSMVGTWRNTAGEELTVTGAVIAKPEGSEFSSSCGVALSTVTEKGLPEVITGGTMTGNYMQGAIGSFDTEMPYTAFSPITLVPKGVQMSDLDDSDSSRDRLILGGGQSGFADSAYYRE